MTLLPAALLIVALGGLGWMIRNDRAEYAAFKLLTETSDRQARYRIWVLKSFALFFGVTMGSLLVLRRLRAVTTLPAEFESLSRSANESVPPETLSPGFVGGLVGTMAVAAVISALLSRRRRGAGKPVFVGDIAALMPRNGMETAHTALMSLNAGVSEELFFRLLLPLLVTLVTGNALLAFAGAAVVFGLVHLFQGWIGVAATTVIGAVLTGLYLWTGALWIAMAAHVAIDLVGLVVRPTLARYASRRTA